MSGDRLRRPIERREKKTRCYIRLITKPQGSQLQRRPNTAPDADGRRNTNRGYRSREALEMRDKCRSIKRNIARNDNRKESNNCREQAPAQGATGKQADKPTVPLLKGFVKVGRANARGLVHQTKRCEIEQWMRRRNIDVLAVQETHVGNDMVLTRAHYTWYHSGGDTGSTIHAGGGLL